MSRWFEEIPRQVGDKPVSVVLSCSVRSSYFSERVANIWNSLPVDTDFSSDRSIYPLHKQSGIFRFLLYQVLVQLCCLAWCSFMCILSFLHGQLSVQLFAAMLSCPTVQFTVCYAVLFGRIKWWWWWWCYGNEHDTTRQTDFDTSWTCHGQKQWSEVADFTMSCLVTDNTRQSASTTRQVGDVADNSTGMSRACRRRHGEVGVMEFGFYCLRLYRCVRDSSALQQAPLKSRPNGATGMRILYPPKRLYVIAGVFIYLSFIYLSVYQQNYT